MDRFSPRLATALVADRHRQAAEDRRSVQASASGRSNVSRSERRGDLRRKVATAIAALLLVTVAGTTAAAGQADIAAVRAATAPFHEVDAALGAGYILFYRCTEEPGIGTMGQHFANLDLVGDPAIDPLRPEVLVYEPKRNGDGYRLVAVEYVTIQELWAGQFGSATPSVLGTNLAAVGPTNRYGMPAFFQRHVWLFEPNPNGIFADWNPNVSCHGTGDQGG